MLYSVFQINIDELDAILVEAYGWDGAAKKSEKVRAYVASTQGTDFEYAYGTGHYRKVAEIDAKSLDDVFRIGNIGPEEQINRLSSMHSVSVGDVIQNPEGVFHAVARSGFEEITG